MLTFYSGQTARVDKLTHTYISIKCTNTQCYTLPPPLLTQQGGGVPANRKGVCARHTIDVARFFRVSHTTLCNQYAQYQFMLLSGLLREPT